ncbi:MAG: DUF58 domain-containing protein [Bacillota bacterium]
MQLSMRDWRVPVLILAALIFARMSGGRLPYFLFYVTAMLWAGSWFWTRHALRRTDCLIQVERDRTEVGQSVGVRVRLDNDTFLPLPWVEVDEKTPQHLVTTDMPRQATSVPLLGSRVISFKLTARRRGHYQVGPIRVRLGDALGFFQGEREFRSRLSVTVFPRVHQIEGLPIPLSQPFGPTRTQERAFEDPSNHAEIRHYVPGDNPRHIHWKTSARVGDLMIRQYELNATTQMTIFLDMNQAVQVGRTELDEPSTEEMGVEIAASLASVGLRRKIETGLVCHGQERFAVSPGRGQRTFTEILEILARAQATGRVPIEQVLEMETAHLSGKSTLVVVTPSLTPRLTDLLLRLRANHQVMLLLLKRETYGPRLAEAPVRVEESFQSLTGLLTLRRIPIYIVPAGADLRLLAEMRITSTGEGVRSWSSGGLQPATS